MGIKKKPEDWYGFQWGCELHYHYSSNMMTDSESHACTRKDRFGVERTPADYLKCKWTTCPKLTAKQTQTKAG